VLQTVQFVFVGLLDWLNRLQAILELLQLLFGLE
jgi:hypothetical protein